MKVTIDVSDEIKVLTKEVEYEPSEVLAVFRATEMTVDKLKGFFELVENKPSDYDIRALYLNGFVFTDFGSYKLTTFDLL